MTRIEHLHLAGDEGWLVARWSGEIDMSNNSSIERATLDAVDNGHTAIVVDLSDVTYVDSAGIHSLVSMQHLLHERQQELLLVVPESSLLRRALQIGGVMAAIRTFPSLAAAHSSLG